MISPPSEFSPSVLATAATVLRGQADALRHISDLYDTDEEVRKQFFKCLETIHDGQMNHGKVILTGMGKSLKIGEKIAASMVSLGIQATSLHPQEALHGDLGMIRSGDVVIMISSSGNTPELKNLYHHIPSGITTVILTCTRCSPLSAIADLVLAAYVPQELSEKRLYGLEAPTVTTTACLAVGDSLTITLAEMLVTNLEQRRKNFGISHPGGNIGLNFKQSSSCCLSGRITYLESMGDFSSERELLTFLIGKEYILVRDEQVLVHVDQVVRALNTKDGDLRQLADYGLKLDALEKVDLEVLHTAKSLPTCSFIVWDKKMNQYCEVYNHTR